MQALAPSLTCQMQRLMMPPVLLIVVHSMSTGWVILWLQVLRITTGICVFAVLSQASSARS
jgi:hypothetical protein